MSDTINETAKKIELNFDLIEKEVFEGDRFLAWRGSFEVKKVYVKKENGDIKCDLDIRLQQWPEGISIKVYKHKALGVFAYLKDESACEEMLKTEAIPCKFWKESFYFSHMQNLDKERYVLLEGNNMGEDETETCLHMMTTHLKEITAILSDL